jgi:hypothetical protein
MHTHSQTRTRLCTHIHTHTHTPQNTKHMQVGLVIYWVAVAALIYSAGTLKTRCRDSDAFTVRKTPQYILCQSQNV